MNKLLIAGGAVVVIGGAVVLVYYLKTRAKNEQAPKVEDSETQTLEETDNVPTVKSTNESQEFPAKVTPQKKTKTDYSGYPSRKNRIKDSVQDEEDANDLVAYEPYILKENDRFPKDVEHVHIKFDITSGTFVDEENNILHSPEKLLGETLCNAIASMDHGTFARNVNVYNKNTETVIHVDVSPLVEFEEDEPDVPTKKKDTKPRNNPRSQRRV